MASEKRRSPQETEKQRWDRNFADLLQELRVAQTGVQILFAFLLTLPFSNGFPKATAFQKDVFMIALISAAFATALIISPVAFHRALFRQGRKPELVRHSHRMATGGLACLLVSMVSSVLLVTDYVLNARWAVVLTVVTAGWFLTFWAILPIVHRNWADDDDRDGFVLAEDPPVSASSSADPDA
jgi:MFS family permease